VYPVFILILATVLVALASMVESFVEVVLKTISSPEFGHTPPTQFAHSVQLFVEPPPPQVLVAA
jgi:hypothetical protein